MKRLVTAGLVVCIFGAGYLLGEVDHIRTSASSYTKPVSAAIADTKVYVDGNVYSDIKLTYENRTYIDIEKLSQYLGKRFDLSDGWINIGRHVNHESFLPNTILIGESNNAQYYAKFLGKPQSIRKAKSECMASEIVTYKFDGATITSAGMIEVTKPVLKTYRGVTIGSSISFVRAQYGEPNKNDSIGDDFWLYGDQKVSTWFAFKDGKVVRFGKYEAEC